MRRTGILRATSFLSTSGSGQELIDEAELSLRIMLPADWSVDAFESCDGTRSMVIMDLSDEAPATYVLSEAPLGLELTELRDDALRSVGECRTVGQLGSILNIQIRGDLPTQRRAA